MKLGAYDHLAKPVMPDAVLRATTGACLQKRWASQREPGEEHTLFFAAPFIGLAYFIAVPFIGTYAVVKYGWKAITKSS